MTEQINTPELRFPEFKEKWKEFSLEDKSDLITKGTTPKVWDKNGEVNFIKVENIEKHSGKVKTTSKISYHEHSTHLKRSILEEGDILFSIAGTLGRITIINKKILPANTNQALAIIRNTSINKYYLKTYLLGKSIKEYIRKNPTVGAQPNLSLKQIKSFKIKTPDFIEQEKIGIFFSKLDRQIELGEKKLELLEQQKKGYMQKIFSQELRFKDDNGNDYPNWAVVKLKDILSERKEYASKTENYPHATLSTSGITLKSDRYNRDFLVKDKSKKYKVTIMNDICYNPANLKFGVITRNRIGSVIFSPIYITFEVNNGYSPLFIELLVTRNDFINRVRKYEEGTVYERMAVKPEDFLNYETEIPCLEEQKKIGDFLVKIDKLIENQSKKIDCLKQRKQGLLQKMFV